MPRAASALAKRKETKDTISEVEEAAQLAREREKMTETALEGAARFAGLVIGGLWRDYVEGDPSYPRHCVW